MMEEKFVLLYSSLSLLPYGLAPCENFFYPCGNNLWHIWNCISFQFVVLALSTCVAICLQIWITERLLLPHTKHVQLRTWLLRRCSTSSFGEFASNPHSLHSTPFRSLEFSIDASSVWETELSNPSKQLLIPKRNK